MPLKEEELEGLKALVVEEKMYPNIPEAIRTAVRDLLKKEGVFPEPKQNPIAC